MAKLKAYSVYDMKIETYAKPFYQLTRGEALRSWTELANDANSQNMVSKHPADFVLFEVGEYDESTGRFENLNAPFSLGSALQYKNKSDDTGNLFDMKAKAN